MSTDTQYDDIQARDSGSIAQTIDSIVSDKRRQRQEQIDLDIEAEVRELLDLAQEALADDKRAAAAVLEELHWYLREDGDIDDVMDSSADLLEERVGLSQDEAAQTRAQFRRQARLRGQDSGRHPNPHQEVKTLSKIAQALGYTASVSDMTPYAPVRLESLDGESHDSPETPTPVGRRRLPKNTTRTREQAAVDIPHGSCDHILCVALPRSGKDSTLTSIGMNLWREHGYKYISVFDDGRMETPMISIPNDEGVIRQNLDRMGQDPRAFDAEVFVPATEGLPDELPANFREFTIGIDSLTPHLILRLAGVNTTDSTVEDRIEQALTETLDNSGGVPELVGRMNTLAESQNATIEWTEKREKQRQGSENVTFNASYSMEQSKAMRKSAARLSKLAGDGIIAGAGASTNLDMRQIVQNQQQAAVLCCNFLPSGMEGLKFTIIDLWLRLVYKVRDQYPRLPRVALEIRELKNLAPSKVRDHRYQEEIKSLQQTIFFLSTNGGSRRVLMLGSTQKLNDVYKPVRTNMATKVLLRLGEEEIETLDRSYNFSFEQKQQLKQFNIGMGMVIAGGDKFYPIELRGAPCGLGLGDQHWLDRYGRARGARVRSAAHSRWRPSGMSDDDWWVHVPDAEVISTDDPPDIGEHYAEWYLMQSDFPEDTDPDDVDQQLVEEVLADRRDYETPSDIHLTDIESSHHRNLTMRNASEDSSTIESVMSRHNVPPELRLWLETEHGRERSPKTRTKFKRVVQAVDEYEDEGLRSYDDIAEHLPFGRSTLSNYMGMGNPLGPVIDKDGKEYRLTDIGRTALQVNWNEVAKEVDVS